MEEYESRLFAFKTTTKIAAYVKSCTDAELMDDANNEVLFDNTFYKLSSSETMRIASWKSNRITLFTLKSFGRRYLITSFFLLYYNDRDEDKESDIPVAYQDASKVRINYN